MFPIARLLLLYKDLNQKRCGRCSLRYEKHLDQCPHCSNLNDFALNAFLEERGIDPNAKSGLGQFIVFAVIVVVVIFFLKQMLKT